MKNVLKKVSAIALAFTLLGSGTTIAKKIDSKSTNTLTASAACQYHRADNVRKGEEVKCEYGCTHYRYYCKCCGAYRWTK